MAHPEAIDWLEIVPENFMNTAGRNREMLSEALAQGFTLVPHGVNLSIGSTDPFDEQYLAHLAALFQWIQPPWFSDHLCFSSVGGVYVNELLPLPHTAEAVDHVVRRIRALQSRFELPFLIENISYYTAFGDPDYPESRFLSDILEQADCGLMLDVNNVYVNSVNHGYDPVAFIEALPLERVVQVHVAGHFTSDSLLIDTHGQAVCPPVFDLLRLVLERTAVNGILLERDTDIPPFAELLPELQQIRAIMAGCAAPAPTPEAC